MYSVPSVPSVLTLPSRVLTIYLGIYPINLKRPAQSIIPLHLSNSDLFFFFLFNPRGNFFLSLSYSVIKKGKKKSIMITEKWIKIIQKWGGSERKRSLFISAELPCHVMIGAFLCICGQLVVLILFPHRLYPLVLGRQLRGGSFVSSTTKGLMNYDVATVAEKLPRHPS